MLSFAAQHVRLYEHIVVMHTDDDDDDDDPYVVRSVDAVVESDLHNLWTVKAYNDDDNDAGDDIRRNRLFVQTHTRRQFDLVRRRYTNLYSEILCLCFGR